MKRTLLLLALLGITSAFTFHRVEQAQDEAEIRATVQKYFDGIMQYDTAILREAFHPDAQIMSSFPEGRRPYYNGSFEEWAQFTNGDAPEDLSGYTNEIVSIDLAGHAAVVKTDLNWPTIRYIDYLSLLKIEGEWKIVNKIWFQERK